MVIKIIDCSQCQYGGNGTKKCPQGGKNILPGIGGCISDSLVYKGGK